MNAKFLKRFEISLVIVSLIFLMLSAFARFTEIAFISAINQWFFTKFGVIDFSATYVSIALFIGVLRSLVQQIELNLQNKVNKSV